MSEKWKKIKEFPNYAVSNQGRVKNLKTERILKASPTKQGYLKVDLCDAKKCVTKHVHRLVAEAFVKNTTEDGVGRTIAYKDENRHNNAASNLEWVIGQHEISEAYKRGIVPVAGDIIGIIRDGVLTPEGPRGRRVFGDKPIEYGR